MMPRPRPALCFNPAAERPERSDEQLFDELDSLVGQAVRGDEAAQ